MVIQVDHLGIVNVIAGREVVKELLQNDANPERISNELARLLDDSAARKALQDELASVVGSLGGGGAHANAAKAVMESLT